MKQLGVYDVTFNKEEEKAIKEFQKRDTGYHGAIGGHIELNVMWTSLGDIVTIKNRSTGEELEIRGTSQW